MTEKQKDRKTKIHKDGKTEKHKDGMTERSHNKSAQGQKDGKA